LDSREFVELGIQLIKDDKYSLEIRCRTGINRIYYGALHFLREREKIMGGNIKRFHSETIKRLKDKNVKVANLLSGLKRLRNKVDYYLNQKISTFQTDEALKYWDRIRD